MTFRPTFHSKTTSLRPRSAVIPEIGRLLGVGALVLGLGGCALQKKEDVAEFREALPRSESIAVAGPEGSSAGAETQSFDGMQRTASTDEPWADGPWSYWYGFTRSVRDGVNGITGGVLGSLWVVVHTEPTSVEEGEAIWGPYEDALDPVAWQLRIQRVAKGEYDYFLEGRPKNESGAEFTVVLNGKGYRKRHEKHGDGFFTIDLDAARELDPFHNADNSGTLTIAHDLPPSFRDDLNALPRTITADVKASTSDQWYTVTSVAKENGSGEILVDAYVDIDDAHDTLPEDVSIASQWQRDGAGRADITMANGDIDEALGVVSAVECWGTDFQRDYYSDSVDYAPTEGDATACAFSEALDP